MTTYIGDGVYCDNDGFHIILKANQISEGKFEHIIYLEDKCLNALLCEIEKFWGVKITVEKVVSDGKEE